MIHFPDDKRGEILAAAMNVFATYGFKKTSMDDIARAGGMSRPALYQLFRNKADIFRALSIHMLDTSVAAATREFEGSGTFADRLAAALDRGLLNVHRMLEQSPHGAELVDVNEEIAADLDTLWHQQLTEVVARGLLGGCERGELDLAPDEIREAAMTFMYALKGIKLHHIGTPDMIPRVKTLIGFFVRRLSARQV